MGLFSDLLPSPPPKRGGMFADLVAELEDEEPAPLPPPEPPRPIASAYEAAAKRALDALSTGAGVVGDVLSIPRALYSDPIARGTSRLALGPEAITARDPATGVPRPETAPELLARGLAIDPRGNDAQRAGTEDYIRAALSSLPTALNTGLLASIGLTPQVLGAKGDFDRAVNRMGPTGQRIARLVERILDVPANVGAGAAVDPLMALSGATTARALGGGAKAKAMASALDRSVARAGVALGAAGAAEGTARAGESLSKGKIDDALVGLAEAVVSAGMGKLSHKGLKELKAKAAEIEHAIDTGPKYVDDPALPAEQRAQLRAEIDAREAADVARQGRFTDEALAEVKAEPLPAREPSTSRAASIEPEPLPAAPTETAPEPRISTPRRFTEEASALLDSLREKALSGASLSDAERSALRRLYAARERLPLETRKAIDAAVTTFEGTDTQPRLPPGETAVAGAAAPAVRTPPLDTPRFSDADAGALADALGEALGREEAAPRLKGRTASVRYSPRALEVAGEGLRGEAIPSEVVEGGRVVEGKRVGVVRGPRGTKALRAELQERLRNVIKGKRAEAARALANQDRAAYQRAAVEEAAIGIGEGHNASVRIGERSVTLRDAYHHLEQLPRVGQELAGRHRAATLEHETLAGRLAAADREARAPLGRTDAEIGASYEPVAQALDGKLDPASLTEQQRSVVAGERAVLDDAIKTYNDARESAGLAPVPVEENYFPRVKRGESLLDIEAQAMKLAQEKSIPLDEAMRRLRGSDLVIATRTDRKGSFEIERTGDLRDVRHDAAVIPEYIEVLARRTAELRHYGVNGSELSYLIAQLPDTPSSARGLKVGDRAFAQTFFDRSRNVAPAGLGTQAGHIVRSLSGLHDLVWAWAVQPLSVAQTASRGGVRGAVRGVLKTVGGEVRRNDFRSARRLASAIRRSIDKAGLDSDRVAATSRHVTDDLLQATAGGSGDRTVLGRVSALSSKAPWIRAMLALDRGGRIAAVQTWRAVGADLLRKAKAGNLAEQRNLEHMGIDWRGIDPADASAMDLAAKRFSDATQYRASIGTLPPWASSPMGRMAFQYLSFIKAHTGTIRFIGSEARKGNLRPLLRFAAIGVPLAVLTDEFKETLKGHGWDEEEITSDNVMAKLRDAASGRTRPDPTKGPQAALAYAARVASILGVGTVYQALLERSGGELTDIVPAGKYVRLGKDAWSKGAEAAKAEAAAKIAPEEARGAAVAEASQKRSEADTAALRAAGSLVPSLPGSDIVREIASAEKPPRPGLAGRVRDWLEDRNIIPVADESTRGAEGRRRIAGLKTTPRTKRERLAAALDPRARRTVEEKLSAAEQAELIAELKLAYIDAVRSGDAVGRLRVIQAFRSLRKPFSRKMRRDLEIRARRPEPESEE